jgi:hypothetical protein
MTELLAFLKSQDGDTLFWYGVFIIVLIATIFNGIARVVRQFIKPKKKPIEEWIDVRTKLPDVDSVVLCLLKGGRKTVCKYTKVFNLEFVESTICVTENVTHWMFLP